MLWCSSGGTGGQTGGYMAELIEHINSNSIYSLLNLNKITS
jgi:hypothetical protein